MVCYGGGRVRRVWLLLVIGLACTPRCGCGDGPARVIDEREFGDGVIVDDRWRAGLDVDGVLRVRFNHVDVVVAALRLGPDATETPPRTLPIATQARPDGGSLIVEYTLEADVELDDVEPVGLAFALRPEPRIFGKQAAAPVLLDGDAGFGWDTGRGELRFEFDPALAKLHYAPDRETVYCGLFDDARDAGPRTFRLRVTLPPGATYGPATLPGWATPDAAWHADTMPWTDVPVDLSFLNADDRPAGRHGPVRIDGDEILRGDGTPLRLWGTNVTSYALFDRDDAAIVAQARRLAALGFNLVRIHHHDSHWVEPNVFGRRAAGTRTLDEVELERIDRWVAALQAEGIYVWLDLEVGRTFTAADGIDAFEELDRGRTSGVAYVNPSVAERMKEFARAYLDRTNHHTGRRYVEDPGIFAVLVTNENDISHHYGNPLADTGARPEHQAWLQDRARAFGERTGLAVPDPIEPWRLGPTKGALADIEAAFFLDAIADLRSLGYRGPVATTQIWGDQALYALPSLTVGDVIDVHAYGHPETLARNAHVDANFLHPIGTSAVAGFPTTVTEWNVPFPTRDRFIAPTLVAATAALQRWDAMMLYAYVSNPLDRPTKPEPWSSWDDPAIMAMMPAAALMFRRRDVSAARERYAIVLDHATVFERSSSASNMATVRSLVERSELRVVLPTTPELPWLRGTRAPTDVTVLLDPDEDRLPAGAHAIESDTGELRRDWRDGVHTVDTARNVSAAGAIGGREISLGDVTFALETPRAAIALSSLDDRPIDQSPTLLLSSVAQVAAGEGTGLPLRSEPVRGAISLRSVHPRLVWTPLGAAAGQVVPVTTVGEAGVHRFALEGAPVHWWHVTPSGP